MSGQETYRGSQMKIEAVDFFYLSMPVVTDDGDGSQDALVVKVSAGDFTGWGECEASPLVSIAAFVTPMSHGACQPVKNSVLGQQINDMSDIERIARLVARNSMDLLQAQHTWSGIEIALWDLLGNMRSEPVWRLLGYEQAYPKTPYASVLFGDTPQQTLERAQDARQRGFTAAKFGWGPFGTLSLQDDLDQLNAAREGLGPDASLLVDAGQIWGTDLGAAKARLSGLEAVGAMWLEEPFYADALSEYADLQACCQTVRIAGGEAAHSEGMARNIIDFGKVGFIQIDCGRIGGIGPAKAISDHASDRGITYVNHTFTSHLALSASLQPYAGKSGDQICEFPAMPRQLARDITRNHFSLDLNGQIHLPDAPGLGMEVNEQGFTDYLIEIEISANGKNLYWG